MLWSTIPQKRRKDTALAHALRVVWAVPPKGRPGPFMARAVASCGVIVWLGSRLQLNGPELVVTELVQIGLVRDPIHLGCVNAAPRGTSSTLHERSTLRC